MTAGGSPLGIIAASRSCSRVAGSSSSTDDDDDDDAACHSGQAGTPDGCTSSDSPYSLSSSDSFSPLAEEHSLSSSDSTASYSNGSKVLCVSVMARFFFASNAALK